MGRIVISAYRPKPGHADALRALVVDHVPRLREAGLATDRAPIAMEAADGTILEVFEWASAEAIQQAHSHPAVQKMWEEFGAVCEYTALSSLAEAQGLFAEFAPLSE